MGKAMQETLFVAILFTMLAIFGSAYLLAYFVRKLWL